MSIGPKALPPKAKAKNRAKAKAYARDQKALRLGIAMQINSTEGFNEYTDKLAERLLKLTAAAAFIGFTVGVLVGWVAL